MRKKKEIPQPPRQPAPLPCSLCDRLFTRAQLTRHHCKPRQKGGGTEDIELLCPQCHGMVHATYTNATLARQYTTIDELRQRRSWQSSWPVKKQPPAGGSGVCRGAKL